jgi:hypothetical protein
MEASPRPSWVEEVSAGMGKGGAWRDYVSWIPSFRPVHFQSNNNYHSNLNDIELSES